MIKCSPNNAPFRDHYESIQFAKKGESREEKSEEIKSLLDDLLKQ